MIGSLGSGAPAAPAASGGLAEPLLAKGGHQAKGWKELHSHGSSSVQTLQFKVNVVCAFAPSVLCSWVRDSFEQINFASVAVCHADRERIGLAQKRTASCA